MYARVCVCVYACTCVRAVHGECRAVRHGLGVVAARVTRGKSDLKKGALSTRCVSCCLCAPGKLNLRRVLRVYRAFITSRSSITRRLLLAPNRANGRIEKRLGIVRRSSREEFPCTFKRPLLRSLVKLFVHTSSRFANRASCCT